MLKVFTSTRAISCPFSTPSLYRVHASKVLLARGLSVNLRGESHHLASSQDKAHPPSLLFLGFFLLPLIFHDGNSNVSEQYNIGSDGCKYACICRVSAEDAVEREEVKRYRRGEHEDSEGSKLDDDVTVFMLVTDIQSVSHARTHAGTAGAIEEVVAGRAGVGCVGAMEDGLRDPALSLVDDGTLRVAMITLSMLDAKLRQYLEDAVVNILLYSLGKVI